MSRRLQDFAFGKSKYERPTQKWVCGWAAEGNACHVGPDKKGRCIATSECFPLKKGDRWHCTRPENLGGRCGDGPLPDGACCRPIPRCQPVLSIRAKRNAFARWLSVLAFGVVLLLISSPGAPDFISSGELASHHNTVALSCSNCHSNFKGGPVAWFRKAVLFSRNTDDSPLCLSCHVLGEESQNPHGLSEKDLTGISQRIRKRPLPESKHAVFSLSSLFKLNPGDSQKRTVACVACHREHRGKDFDLAAMDDQRCQFCHTNKYASFSDGHPEFSGFPYVRRTRLIFNHFSHLTKHFKGEAKNQAPTTCKSCHVPDPSGSSMTVRNFETTCDACHGSQILGEGRAGAKGIPFFTLPGLDVETLQEANVDIGEWPEGAEEEITPFMRFHLLANPKFKKLEADLGDADLLDLVDAEKAQLAAAGNLAWAVKGTLFELVSKGQKGLKEQLERALGRSLSAFELSSLSGLLPNDLVRSAQRSWLPRLFVEMARRSEKDLKEEDEKKKEEPEGEGGEEDAEEAPADEETSIAGGWYVQDYSLFYKPSGHKDLFLASWLNLTGERKRAEPSEDVKGQIFTALSDRKSPGLCGKCHSVDEEKDGSLKVNWIERRPAINVKEFNRYRHSPHFSLLDEKGCLTCHILNSDADYLGSFKDFDPATFASNFQAIPKAVCVNCHTTEGAVSTCQTCHNYHIGKTMPALISAPMQMPGATR